MSFLQLTKVCAKRVEDLTMMQKVLIMLEARFGPGLSYSEEAAQLRMSGKPRLVAMCKGLVALKGSEAEAQPKLSGSDEYDTYIYLMTDVNKAFGTNNRLDSIGVVNDFVTTVCQVLVLA